MIAALTDALRIDAGDLDLFEVVIPEIEFDESAGEEPPVDSRWDWVEQTTASKRSKGQLLLAAAVQAKRCVARRLGTAMPPTRIELVHAV